MTAQERFSQMVERLAVRLRGHGFARQGTSFSKRAEGGNWHLVELPKSGKSTADIILFAIDVGICSARLRKFFVGERRAVPTRSDCHFAARLAMLVHGKDRWWTVDHRTDTDALSREVGDLIATQGVATFDRYGDDASLRDLWLSGASPGLTDVQRLTNLVVLLHDIGPREYLDDQIQRVTDLTKGRPTSGLTKWVLSRLGLELAR